MSERKIFFGILLAMGISAVPVSASSLVVPDLGGRSLEAALYDETEQETTPDTKENTEKATETEQGTILLSSDNELLYTMRAATGIIAAALTALGFVFVKEAGKGR